MLPTSYSDWATLTRYCTVLYCTVLYYTALYSLTSLDLRHNPWQCDCHAQWLLAGLVPAMYNNTPDMLHGD